MQARDELTLRMEQVLVLREHYRDFKDFLRDAMEFLGFKPTWMQYDIADYLQHGPSSLMVQAQRGEAKTTITAIFAVWSLIMDTTHRIVIVSAGEKMTKEISTLITKLIGMWDILECLRPGQGDRTAVEAYDIYGGLKGVDKSPSVSCMSIGGNLQGARGDLIIGDDVESTKNSRTANMREQIAHSIKEFSAWLTRDDGRIVILGTPQSTDSVYNSLPSQGYDIRIWPGRYPTAKELPNYGKYLAPSLIARMEADPSLMTGGHIDGRKGKPTDPALFDEDKQVQRWWKWQEAGYQLQYMLNTRLIDALRFPLKAEKLVIAAGNGLGKYPMSVVRSFGNALRAVVSADKTYHLTEAHSVSPELAPFESVLMHVDPAGGGLNGDETGYAVVGFLAGTIWLLEVGGAPGGYSEESQDHLTDVALRWKPNTVTVEKNYGNGAFAAMWLPKLRKVLPGTSLEEVWATGQKELRIIDTLEPIMARGALVVTEGALESDNATTERYGGERKATYSLLYQMTHVTRVARCLKHDDRLDALEGACRPFVQRLAVDAQEQAAKVQERDWAEFLKDPLGRKRCVPLAPTGTSNNLLNKYRR